MNDPFVHFRVMVKERASDLVLREGERPAIRAEGKIRFLSDERVTPEEAEAKRRQMPSPGLMNETAVEIEMRKQMRERVAARIAGAHGRHPLGEAIALLQDDRGSLAAKLRRRQRAVAILTALATRGSGQAANILGVLAVRQAKSDPRRGTQSLAEAQAEFVAAVRADPRDENAKYNLELLLAQRTEQARRKAQQPVAKPKAGRGRRGSSGSGF